MRGEPRQNPRVFYRESDFYRGPPSNRDWASFKSKLGGVKGLFWKPGNPVLPKTFLFLIPRNLQNFFFLLMKSYCLAFELKVHCT